MTTLDTLLAHALLAPERTVPRDIVPTTPPTTPQRPPAPVVTQVAPNTDAADDLRALCETLVTHTPAQAVTAFVTDQVPEPRSALILACVLQLTDTDEGARFWWQYAAGAGQPAAAYCLYLHHLALGENDAAHWWHRQTNDVHPTQQTQTTIHHKKNKPTVLHHDDQATTTTLLRVLRTLARHVTRPRSAAVSNLMDYMPIAVAVGYLRAPDIDLPLPGPGFAHHIKALLDAAAQRPDHTSDLPARPHTPPQNTHPPQNHRVGETASR
ncbi:hypothetical protein ACIO3O_41920 [Streptomyces sp. NPDC087440]|uniref:hypothetical protein n=1 Tax=Streptomyces sp. NPDC087440 TaxID=3365790 RepID=UPI0037F901C8